MAKFWILAAMLLSVIALLLLLVTTLLTTLMPWTGPEGSGGGGGGDTAVVRLATQMATHLHCFAEPVPPSDCADPSLRVPMDSWYDAGFPQAVLTWGQQHCAGCPSWQNGTFQCVVFVIGAYTQTSTLLPVGGQNADEYWAYFAHQPGWVESQIPTPGAIMAWSGGLYGHVSIVLSVDMSRRTITFAQANGQMPIQTLPLRSDGSVDTANGYWNYFQVQGYIRPESAPPSGPPSPGLPESPYVQVARDAAHTAGIAEATFIRQIEVESGFNPTAVSPVGAIGIAQFMPETAASLGINPWDPVQSLGGAARLMAGLTHDYGGDSAKALAAYNAGKGTVDGAVATFGADWLRHLPAETQQYIHRILE